MDVGEQRPKHNRTGWKTLVVAVLFGLGLAALIATGLLLRLSVVTDHLYSAVVKDPERNAPDGNAIVSPADGRVLYVRRIEDGVIPEVVKRGVPVPVVDHAHGTGEDGIESGWLIGIYMNTHGVHINRMPDHAEVEQRLIFNGPHMDMTAAERRIILTQLVPGTVTARKLLGMSPFGIEDDADFILESARETLVLRDARGKRLYVVRIADYYVGKILTWVGEGQAVRRGDRIGMITWGSQTDLFIEDSEGLDVTVDAGTYVYAGETVVATY